MTKQSLSPIRWFWISLICFLPLHLTAVVLDDWFTLPPKPIGDGPDYEAIGYGISQGHGWSTSYSDPQWRIVYHVASKIPERLDYGVQLARVGPVVADTNRPPLFPLCIAIAYQCMPRGPIAFAAIRIGLACCLSIGCALAVAWGVAFAKGLTVNRVALYSNAVGLSIIAIVYTERNVRNYTTDFLTEPLALLLTQAFLVTTWYGSKRGTWQWAATSGVLFAGMYFCRSVFVLWLPFVIPWLWYAYRCDRNVGDTRLSPSRWILVWAIGFGLISSTWWVRNCWVLESLHPLGTKGATTLMGGYCDEAFSEGGEWQAANEKELRGRLESTLDLSKASASDFRDLELRMGVEANARVKKWTTDNLKLLPQLILKRIVTEWNPYTGKALVMKIFAAVGMVVLFRNHKIILLWLAGPLIINTAIVATTYSVGGRFLVPTYGEIYILSAFGIAELVSLVAVASSRSTTSSSKASAERR